MSIRKMILLCLKLNFNYPQSLQNTLTLSFQTQLIMVQINFHSIVKILEQAFLTDKKLKLKILEGPFQTEKFNYFMGMICIILTH